MEPIDTGMHTRAGYFFEDLDVGGGFHTMGRTITQADLTSFVALVGMYEEMFINEGVARDSSVFGGRVVPGLMVHAFAEGLLTLTGALRGTGMALLSSQTRIFAPTFVGDTITVEVKVLEKRLTSKADRGIVTTENVVRNQDGQAVMEILPVRMIRCRSNQGLAPT
jgi:acyl dehydratase